MRHRNYLDADPDYLDRQRELNDLEDDFENRFPKRFKKARRKDNQVVAYWNLKEVKDHIKGMNLKPCIVRNMDDVIEFLKPNKLK